jgi:hypothetical protein
VTDWVVCDALVVVADVVAVPDAVAVRVVPVCVEAAVVAVPAAAASREVSSTATPAVAARNVPVATAITRRRMELVRRRRARSCSEGCDGDMRGSLTEWKECRTSIDLVRRK